MKRLLITAAALLAACSPANESANDPAPDVDMQAAPADIGAYMIVRGRGYEAADLGPYAATLGPIYAKYGGRYVAFETDIDVAEGNSADQAVIISAWPSKAAARAFWDSPEYREAIKLRDGVGTFDVVIVGAIPQG